ncbi:hypothetical protein GWI33_006889 [Rhynchophorus ferrugineus]|uniref:Uncharacterized protein n=1 Tax=Rhynchophorus ferrugineus TaxID=354439 RepID=A0A834IKZ9_RHYFE|nr:hypothetical protein GWI33_006889 [Rhynchophorus ferrugineus]
MTTEDDERSLMVLDIMQILGLLKQRYIDRPKSKYKIADVTPIKCKHRKLQSDVRRTGKKQSVINLSIKARSGLNNCLIPRPTSYTQHDHQQSLYI